ncbi:MAG: membrane dipeptidase, partial [Sphingosinicella sp.]|nr:membrane dipeptidase [Sphingosinicella sp.]
RALFMKHLVHTLNLCGEDHVGIGSDQSITPVDISPAYMDIVRKTAEARQKAGIGAPGEGDGPIAVPDLNSARRMEIIAAELDRAKYPARVIEKVIGGNFDRLFREVWKA